MTKGPGFSLVNSNYFQLNGSNENMSLVTMSKDLGHGFNASLGAGVDFNSNYRTNTCKDPRYAIEGKLKYNINNNLNAQFRYRRRGDTDQYRMTFGGSYNFDKNNSIYSSAHLTVNSGQNVSANTGAWIGYTHKWDNGVSISAEAQVNAPLDKPLNQSLSDESNYLINTIVSIPLF